MKNFYFNKIAKDWDRKRNKPWRPFVNYIKSLRSEGFGFKGVCVDLGCGNGRHFSLFKKNETHVIGLDKSLELLKIAKKKNTYSDYPQHLKPDLILAVSEYLPFRNSSIDNVFSVATLHHLEGRNSRKKTIVQIYDILKNRGYFLFTVWRRWQRRFRSHFIKQWFKRKLLQFRGVENEREELKPTEFGDIIVPWTISSEDKKVKRFYHLFSKREIKTLIKPFKIHCFNKKGGPTESDNFFVLAQKLEQK